MHAYIHTHAHTHTHTHTRTHACTHACTHTHTHTHTHTLGRGPNSELRKRMTIMTMTEEMNPTSCVFPPVASWSTVRLSAPAVGKLPKNAPPKFITP